MKLRFTTEQKLLHKMILHANDMPAPGLFNGQMGIILVLVRYARIRNIPALEMAADFLMEQVMDHLTNIAPLNLANGLAGIGWGIEYLIQNGYTKGCAADICEEIDQKLMERDICRINDLSLEYGLEGLLHYVIAHIQGATKCRRKVFDTEYLKNWQIQLENCKAAGGMRPELQALTVIFEQTLQGHSQGYTWSLHPFIHPSISPRTNLLGLHAGIAGIINGLLEGGEA